MLTPRIVKLDNSILPAMYKEWWILVAVYNDCMYFHKNEIISYEEESQDKKAMYEKMRVLKADPVRYKALEQEAFDMLTTIQKKSEAVLFHRDAKLRELINNLN